MTRHPPSPDQQRVIEEFGLAFEAHGMPRMAGRVLGRLLMCWPPHQSMTDLGEALRASKGSISTTTRLLVRLGFIERLSLPGDRQDYFRAHPGSIPAMFQQNVAHARMQIDLLERAMAVADDQSPQGLTRLTQARDFFAFMHRELPALLARWESERTDTAGPPIDPFPKEDA
ncbi:MAG: siderophore transport transcriptional regulator MmpR5 [Thermoleophilia bacterium]